MGIYIIPYKRMVVKRFFGIIIHFVWLHKKGVFFLVNIDKIKSLCKEKGMSVAFLCRNLGLQRSYLNDVKLGASPMTPDRLEKIAEILDVNVEYLNDETEERKTYKTEKSPSTEELSPKKKQVMELLDSMSDDQMDLFIAIMKETIKNRGDNN